jgi:hypothetical protein
MAWRADGLGVLFEIFAVMADGDDVVDHGRVASALRASHLTSPVIALEYPQPQALP